MRAWEPDQYGVWTLDGQRFLRVKEDASANADSPFAGLTQIHVVLDWFSELQARVPTGR